MMCRLSFERSWIRLGRYIEILILSTVLNWIEIEALTISICIRYCKYFMLISWFFYCIMFLIIKKVIKLKFAIICATKWVFSQEIGIFSILLTSEQNFWKRRTQSAEPWALWDFYSKWTSTKLFGTIDRLGVCLTIQFSFLSQNWGIKCNYW